MVHVHPQKYLWVEPKTTLPVASCITTLYKHTHKVWQFSCTDLTFLVAPFQDFFCWGKEKRNQQSISYSHETKLCSRHCSIDSGVTDPTSVLGFQCSTTFQGTIVNSIQLAPKKFGRVLENQVRFQRSPPERFSKRSSV